MMEPAWEEKRRAPRWAVTKLLEVRSEDGATGTLANLSHGGFMLTSLHPMEQNRVMRMEIELPLDQEGFRRVEFYARCVWCQRSSFSDEYGAGFQIEAMAAEDRSRVRAFFGL